MTDTTTPSDFNNVITTVKSAVGKTRLNDEDMLYLAADEIARSFTRDEIDTLRKESIN